MGGGGRCYQKYFKSWSSVISIAYQPKCNILKYTQSLFVWLRPNKTISCRNQPWPLGPWNSSISRHLSKLYFSKMKTASPQPELTGKTFSKILPLKKCYLSFSTNCLNFWCNSKQRSSESKCVRGIISCCLTFQFCPESTVSFCFSDQENDCCS